MPSILERYFYQVDTGDDDYTRTPNGPPVVQRLIKGKSDVWLSPQGQALKPKTLLIDKNEFMFDRRRNILQKLKTIRELLNATPPFECWVWVNNHFVQLSHHNLHLLDFSTERFEYPTPSRTNPDTIEEKFVLEKEVSNDSITSIDSHDLKQIAANEDLDFTAWVAYSNASQLDTFYRKSRHPIQAIEYTEEDIKSNVVTTLEGRFKVKAFSSPHDWKGFGIDYGELKSPKRYPDNVELLHGIKGHNKSDRRYLPDLLRNARDLQSLQLTTDCDSRRDCPPLPLEDIALLEQLYFITVTTNILAPNEIGTLLTKAPHLETLFLDVQKENINLEFKLIFKVALPHLRRLSIRGYHSSLMPNQFLGLLTLCPNVENLDIALLDLPPAYDRNAKQILKKLNKLHLAIEFVQDVDLLRLLKHTPELDSLTLDIRNYKQTKEPLDFSTLKLDHLTFLKLQSTKYLPEHHDITFDQRTITFLNKAQNLEKLELQKINFQSDSLILLSILPLIKTITLNECKIDSKTLPQLLNKTPSLETLSIHSGEEVIELDEHLTPLPHLDYINLSGQSISAQHLMHLLESAPNLKSINLKGMKITGNVETVREGILAHLEQFRLSETMITPTNCYALLTHNPNLKQLSFENLKLSEGDMPPCHLSQLEDISINKTTIKAPHLSSLLSQAETLDRLTLTESSIYETLRLHTPLPNLRTLSLKN